MAGKRPSQESPQPSKSPESGVAPAKPASAPATRVLPQRQGLHSPRGSSAGKTSQSTRPSSSSTQQRNGPEKQSVPTPIAAGTPSAQPADAGTLQQQQQAPEEQSSSPRPTRPRNPAGAPGSRPTSGIKRLTRSDAEEARAAAEKQAEVAAAEAERQAAEDAEQEEEDLLEHAAQIRRLRDSLARPAPPAAEPKRPKTHWDHLLEEMTWLSKEFQKERKWKLNMAKKYVRAVARSNLDLESRSIVKQRDAELAIRRKAAFIGKEVMQFWKKAERVMVYKRQSQLDARKKVAMDKHLSFLVDQTQKYSSLLAQRLGVGGEELLALPAPQTGPKAEDGPPGHVQAAKAPPAPDVKTEEPVIDADGAEDAARGSAAVTHETPQDAQEEHALAHSGADDRMEVSEEDHADSSQAAGPSLPTDQGVAALGQEQPAGEDDGDDFRAGTGSDEDDDEATLEEEEALARAAGEESGDEGELAALNDEADMPLEQLMALYGYVPEGGDSAGEASPSEGPVGQGDHKDTGSKAGRGGIAAPDRHGDAGLRASTPMDDGQEMAEQDANKDDNQQSKGLADLMQKVSAENGGEGGADEDYASSGSEADDEATLEEEDALAAQDGLDLKEEEDAEVAALAGEADMPLEQLLAMYGMVIDEDQADKQDSTKGREGEVSDLGPSRPRKRRRLAPEADAEALKETQNDMEAKGDAELKQAANSSRHTSVMPATPGVAAPSVVAKAASQGAKEEAPPAVEDADRALAELEKVTDGKAKLEGVARLAEQAQPKGSTLDSAGVHTPVPFLLKGSLREYQHVGLDWLVTIYTRRLNGILADEMGLGKTIMTIALLAHLACEKGVWGPHLIVVPTSVMLNWEVECKKWCPAFKLLTYYGSAKERKAKRQGWSKPNAFHICITSYTLVLQDAKMFRRKKWKYLILDEAHMIKNWKSQRWQTLLNFSSQRRLLITGTPLQNDLMELWSLMHFLMPQVFASHAQFKDWFSNPLTGMVEGQEAVNKVLVERLHSVLRPFLLRRLKRDVEKQLPGKHEHVIKCRLSKRQRTLYEDYMAASDVRSTLSSGNFLGIINVLMQLRKVCNHPDLFEGRSIISAFDMLPAISTQEPSAVLNLCQQDPASTVSLGSVGSAGPALQSMSAWEAAEVQALETPGLLIQELAPTTQRQSARAQRPFAASLSFQPPAAAHALVQQSVANLQARRRAAELDRRQLMASVNERRCGAQPAYGEDLLRAVHVELPVHHVNTIKEKRGRHLDFSQAVADAVKTAAERAEEIDDSLKTFMFVIPKCRAAAPEIWCSRPDPSAAAQQQATQAAMQREWFARSQPLRTALVRQQVFFPDRRLIQFDCGKLQELAILLRKLKSGGHKALIFTQMARMLDILEVFLNLHGYTYVRLDGTTKPEQRQILMQRYNTNPKLFIFILSTRSGGVGMNLTGADSVIFYDSDWNPAMDAQAQDRCHRIGQTREVHIYRLVSESTIEENILHKSDQKRQLDHLAIQSGGFNTDFLQKFNPRELLGVQAAAAAGAPGASGQLSAEEMQAAMQSVEDETDQAAAQALQLETEAELAEFNADPAPKPLDPEAEEDDNDADDTRDPEASGALEKPSQSAAASQPSTELPPMKAEAEEGGMDMMDDVAAMAGHGMSTDPLATLESALQPVERYAVHFLEEQAAITAEVEAAAAAVEAELDAQEWNMQEIERIQEEQEAEIEEDVEATRVLDWDTAAADAAYRAKVEEAEARQRLLLEQRAREEAAWLEQQEALLAMQAALPVHQPIYTSRAARKTRTPELEDAESQQYSPYPRFSRKRARTARGRTVVRPRWPGEDATPSGSREDSDGGLSSADEASQPWPGARSKRHASMLSPQSARQRSRLAGSSLGYHPESVGIKQEASEVHSPGLLGAAGASDIPQPYNTARQYPQIGQLRAPARVWLPWDVLEDVVLATMIEEAQADQPGQAQKEVSATLWQLISDALAAGAATLSTTAAAAARQPMKLRTAQQCRERYELLLAALHASRCQARPAAALPARSVPGASPARQGSVSMPARPGSAAVSAASQALGSTSQAGLSLLSSPAGSAAGAAAGTGLPTSMHGAAAAATGRPAGSQAANFIATQASAPPPAGAVAALAGPPHAGPGGASQQGPAPNQAQPAQQAPSGAAAQHSSAGAPSGSMQAELPGQQKPEPETVGGPVVPNQAWSLAAGLETVREHLAWLASSNIVCSPEGLRIVAAAAMGGQLPAEGSSAAQLADVMAELQSLPRNGQLHTAGTVEIPPLHKSFSGSAEHAHPLQVAQADAVVVKSAVAMAAGAPSRGVIRHLDAIVGAVRSGGVKVGNAALRQLLHMPRQPAVPASPAPQLRPPPSQQQQQLHGSAAGVPQGVPQPAGGPVPRQMYNQAGAGMYAGYQTQYTTNAQGQPPGVRPGMPAATRFPQQVPGVGVPRPYLQGSQLPGQVPGSGQLPWRPQQSQAGFGMAARPGLPAQPGLPAYLRPALMQQVQQVVGHMHPGTGGVQKAPQPAVPLIPGLQALLAQQAATTPGALQGQPTSSQSQQYNLALLHSLLAQAHSAGAPAGAAIPGSASQPARPYLPSVGTLQTGVLAQGMTQAPRPQLPVSGTSQIGQPGTLAQGMSQGWQPGLPTPGLPGQGFQPLQRPVLAASPVPAEGRSPALQGGAAERRSTQLAATVPNMPLQSQQAGQNASLEQGNIHEQQGN